MEHLHQPVSHTLHCSVYRRHEILLPIHRDQDDIYALLCRTATPVIMSPFLRTNNLTHTYVPKSRTVSDSAGLMNGASFYSGPDKP